MTCHPSQWGERASATERSALQGGPREGARAWRPVNKGRCLGCILKESWWIDGMKTAMYPVQCSRRPVEGETYCIAHEQEINTPQFRGDYPVPNLLRLKLVSDRLERWNHGLIAANDLKRGEVHNAATKISACWRGKIVREQLALNKMLPRQHQRDEWANDPQEDLETVQEDTWCELGKRLTEMSNLVSSLEERLSHAETDEESEEDDEYQQRPRRAAPSLASFFATKKKPAHKASDDAPGTQSES
jgi:hypothetical protein